ncbi:MAG: hypothetical protein ACI8RZ_002811 [Myxococcota bacterium]|jgi:hypothetical protein
MLFMVIESFRDQDARAVYARLEERGRMMPTGLTFVDSWVEASNARCFQLIESDDVSAIQRWCAQWQDLVSFEVVPVVSGKTTRAVLMED